MVQEGRKRGGRTRPKYQPMRPSEEPLRVNMAIVRMIDRKVVIAWPV